MWLLEFGDRLEHAVGETKTRMFCAGLLPEIVVNPIDLMFVGDL